MTDTSRMRLSGIQRAFIIVAAVSAVAAVTMSEASRTVFVPMMVALLVALAFTGELWRRDGILPVDEIGLWFAGVVTIYTVWPLLVFQIVGLEYTPFNDSRLFQIQPLPTDIGRMGWWHVAFLSAFVTAYLIVRGMVPVVQRESPKVSRSRLIMTLVAWTGTIVISAIVSILYPSSAETYAGGYAAVANLPLAIRQIVRLSSSFAFIVNLLLLVWLFSDYRKRRWIIWGWLGYQVLSIILNLGSRSGVMLSLAACIILFHLRVRFVRPLYAVLLGVAGLGGFLVIGVIRAVGSIFGGATTLPTLPLGGEFESLFGNAVDLYSRSTTGGVPKVPLGVYLADIVAPIPSQLLPFEKMDQANWYMATFYPEALEQGQGLAFGSMAQAVIGLGVPEVLLRGALLGVIFAAAFRFYRRRQGRLWVVVGYLWLTLWAYQSYRASTLALFSPFVQQFLLALFVFEIGSALLENSELETK